MKRFLVVLAVLMAALPLYSQTTKNGLVITGTTGHFPPSCSTGDQFNTTDTGSIYTCVAGVWQITGGAGATGPTGPTGPTGAPGPAGSISAAVGPTPWTDITASPYNARAVATNGCYNTTATGSGTSFTLASACAFQTSDGISIYGAGPTITATTPSAPTVESADDSWETNTGYAVADTSGATTYTYKIFTIGAYSSTPASNQWGSFTAASAAASTTTGAANLGDNVLTISTLSSVNGTVTVTLSASCSIPAGARVKIGGTSNDAWFGFQGKTNTACSGSAFTYLSGNISSATVNGTGGTATYTPTVLVYAPAPSPGFTWCAFQTAPGAYFVGCAKPGITDPQHGGSLYVEDYGPTWSGNQLLPKWFPTTPPAAAQNAACTTTIASGGGTTSINTFATCPNSVTGGYATIDAVPGIIATGSAGFCGNTGHSPLFIPPTSSGSIQFVIGSYLKCATVIKLAGKLLLDNPIEINGGTLIDGSPSGWAIENTGQEFNCAPVTVAYSALPGLFLNGTNNAGIQNLCVTGSANNNELLALANAGSEVFMPRTAFFANGSTTDCLGAALILDNNGFLNADQLDSQIGNQTGTCSASDAPAVTIIGSLAAQLHHTVFNARGIALQGALTLDGGSWNQGARAPMVSVGGATCSLLVGIGGVRIIDVNMDTSGEPVFANECGGTYPGTVEIKSAAINSPFDAVTGGLVTSLKINDNTPGETQGYDLTQALSSQSSEGVQSAAAGQLSMAKPIIQRQPSPSLFAVEETPATPSGSLGSGGTLTVGQPYFLEVVACFGAGNGCTASSSWSASTTPTTGNQTITWTWTPTPGAVAYDAYFCEGGSTSTCTVASGGFTACENLKVPTCTISAAPVLWTSNLGPTAPSGGFPEMTANGVYAAEVVVISTGTTVTMGQNGVRARYLNQEATAGTGVTYTLPPITVGARQCVENSGTTGVVNTGALTVYPQSGSFVIYKGVVNTVGGGGTHGIASGGAAGDSACFLAIDLTHWEVTSYLGTWTEN